MFVVDRIEGDFLIIEGEVHGKDEPVFFQMPRVLLPDAKEGDCLDIAVNPNETQKREEKINRLMDDLLDEAKNREEKINRLMDDLFTD